MFIFFVNNIPKGAGGGGAQQLREFTVLQRARFYFLNAGSSSQLSVNPVPRELYPVFWPQWAQDFYVVHMHACMQAGKHSYTSNKNT